jgi:hypothetical protein
MTPLQTIEDAPKRTESWSTAVKILACSTAAMCIAVVLLAWYAAGLTPRPHGMVRQVCVELK